MITTNDFVKGVVNKLISVTNHYFFFFAATFQGPGDSCLHSADIFVVRVQRDQD